jgi:transposase-like protein
VAKKRVGRYPKEFRRMAVERLKSCDNIVALAQELGVHRRLLYKWRDQLEPMEESEGSLLHNSRVETLRKEVCQHSLSQPGGTPAGVHIFVPTTKLDGV